MLGKMTHNQIQSWFALAVFLVLEALTCNIQAGMTSGARIMEYPVSARVVALGEAFTALADDASAMHYNPAGLNLLTKPDLALTFIKSFEDIYFTTISAAMPINSDLSLGLNLAYLNGGKIEIIRVDGIAEQRNAEQDFLIEFAGGFRIYQESMLGVNIKLLKSTLADEYSTLAFAIDAGLLYTLVDKLTFGFCLRNLGPSIQYDQEPDALPTSLSAGFHYPYQLSDQHKLNLNLDIKKPLDLSLETHGGVEYIYNSLFSLRGGYVFSTDKVNVSLGAGVCWEKFKLDYTFLLFRELGNNQILTLGLAF